MEPSGDIVVERTLPIDGALLGDVLLRLRRDAHAAVVHWTLGDHGTAELDVNFTSKGSTWHTNARLWERDHLALVHAAVVVTHVADDSVQLHCHARAGAPRLVRALADELAEELLWHAARAGVS